MTSLDPQLLRLLVQVFVSAFVAVGATLLAVLGFLARGILARLSRMESTHTEQFVAFGRQLHDVRSLVTEDLHKHDNRIVRLEEWRKGFDRARGMSIPDTE